MDEFVTKNKSDYVISEETSAVVFVCEANYPIMWHFPYPKQLNHVKSNVLTSEHYRISTFGFTVDEPTNNGFRTTIRITGVRVEFFSVNLTCISTDMEHEVKSSIHIYLKGKTPIENMGKTLQILIYEIPERDHMNLPKPTNHPPLVIPCRPALPEMRVSLEQELKELPREVPGYSGTQPLWMSFTPTSKSRFKFDPKIGFRIDYNHLGVFVLGLFRCSVLENDEEYPSVETVGDKESEKYVYVNITLATAGHIIKSDENEMNLEPRSVLRGKASVTLEQYTTIAESNVKCCSGVENKPPKQFFQPCDNLLSCQLAKSLLEELALENKSSDDYVPNRLANGSTSCDQLELYGTGQVVMCKGENIDFVDTFINLVHPLAGGPVKNRSSRILLLQSSSPNEGVDTPTGSNHHVASLSRYESLTHAKTANVSQKILLIVGRNSQQQHSEQIAIYGSYDSLDVLQDESSEEDIYEEEYSGPLLIDEYDRDEYYEGEPMIFMCFGVKYFYAQGSHLRINWKNGTKSLLESSNYTQLVRKQQCHLFLSDNCTMFNELIYDDVAFIFGSTIKASKEIQSVDCFMPEIYSEKWDKISKELNILPSVAPDFAEKKEDVVYFYLGDVGSTISCNVTDGLPEPEVEVTRNGKQEHITIRKFNYSQTDEDGIQGKLHNAEIKVESLKMDTKLISIRISFYNTSYEHQGVYQCIASNVNTSVTRTVRVVVIAKSSNAFVVPLSIVGALCFVLIGLGVRQLLLKRAKISLTL